MRLDDEVYASLLTAVQNGYAERLSAMTDEQLAEDLHDCDANLENIGVDRLTASVRRVRRKAGVAGARAG